MPAVYQAQQIDAIVGLASWLRCRECFAAYHLQRQLKAYAIAVYLFRTTFEPRSKHACAAVDWDIALVSLYGARCMSVGCSVH